MISFNFNMTFCLYTTDEGKYKNVGVEDLKKGQNDTHAVYSGIHYTN